MPELPEIETVARGLTKHIKGKTIAAVTPVQSKDLTGKQVKAKFIGTPKQLKDFVVGQQVSGIERRAKWLIIRMQSGYGFVIHLKMTGQLLFQPPIQLKTASVKNSKKIEFLGGHTMEGEASPSYPNSHTRVIFTFTDGSQLFFQDSRRFGYVELYSPEDIEEYFKGKKLALEPMDADFTLTYFTQQLQRRSRTTIKAALLDQTTVAGPGNIYVDDALHLAKVHPTRVVASLTPAELKRIHQAVKKIIQKGIDLGGTSFSSFLRVDGKLGQYWEHRRAYGRTGEPCIVCKTPIKKIRVAGRGTHYCPTCQPAK